MYDTLFEKLKELDSEQLSRLIPYLKNKVKFIVTTSSSEGKAFQLFEVLNDRGKSLEPMDLVKNNFLKILYQAKSSVDETEIIEFNENWNQFINNLVIDSKRKISSSVFMKHFIVSEYGRTIKKENLFNFFTKDQKYTARDVINIAKKLKKLSKTYSSIEKNALNNEFLCNDTNLYILYKLLGIKQLHPILMRFYETSQEVKKQVTSACVRFSGVVIFSSIQTNFIENQLPIIVTNTRNALTKEDEANSLELEITRITSDYRDQMINSLTTRNFANSNGKPTGKSLDIFKFIELYFVENPLIITPPKTISLEHILPQKTNSKDYSLLGFSDESDFQRHLNRLGNLTLLYNDENASAGIKTVNEKKSLYQQSDFVVTRSIIQPETTAIKNGQESKKVQLLNQHLPQFDVSTVWNKEKIVERSQAIANLLSHSLIPATDRNNN